jgi:DNA-binding IscR family transcriptional regulator
MAEIIAALEGPIAITECIEEVGDCAHERLCPVRSNWHRINEAVLAALQDITLAEMVHPLAALAPLSHRLVTLGRGTGSTPQPQV